MKQFFLTFLIFLSVLTLSACGSTPTLHPELPAAEVSCRDTVYSVSAESTEDGVVITLLSPDSVSGISYRYEGDEMTIDCEGLQCITDSAYLPDNAIAASFYAAVTESENAQYEYSEDDSDIFTACDGRFVFRVKDGQISEICDNQYGYDYFLATNH
ncbi:MAG: hypothetical protein IJH32_04775 [Ruminococcus sp.]|nr:hypothetical protein [Ruminococcus sp.]